MLSRILLETLRRRKRRVGLAVFAVFIGAALVATLFTVASEIGDRVARELRAYGANIVVTSSAAGLEVDLGGASYAPLNDQALIDENSLPKLKTIFWRHNIIGFAPFLNASVDIGEDASPVTLTGTWFERSIRLPRGTTVVAGAGQQEQSTEETIFKTGVRLIAPWWKIEGTWPVETDERGAIVGAAIAERLRLRLGDRFVASYQGRKVDLSVSGIVTTGGYEENQVFVNLPVAQRALGIENGVSRVMVSALTMPKEKLAPDIRDKRPEEMTPKEYEKWYCSPVVEAVAKQIEEVIPGSVAKPVRQFSEQEGSFSTKMQMLLALVTATAIAASALGVMATMTTLVFERRPEIGLMKAIGAQDSQVALIFMVEAAMIGAAGGLAGYFAGAQLSGIIGERVFGLPLAMSMVALPLTLLLAVAIAMLGSALPVRQAVGGDPIILLRQG